MIGFIIGVAVCGAAVAYGLYRFLNGVGNVLKVEEAQTKEALAEHPITDL